MNTDDLNQSSSYVYDGINYGIIIAKLMVNRFIFDIGIAKMLVYIEILNYDSINAG